MGKHKIFLILTLCIAVIDFVFVFANYQLSNQAFEDSIKQEGEVLRSGFELMLKQEEHTMRRIATYVANDPEVRRIFREGVVAAKAEGGGKGGPEAERLRGELLAEVNRSWTSLQKKFGDRQLHFHYGPKITSFLRVHKPKKFGDDLDAIRHTLTYAYNTGKDTSGFETGRVYSGIRGVVPVYGESDEVKPLGTIEVGTSFSVLLDSLDKELGVGSAIFLNDDHVAGTMWPDAVEERTIKGESEYSGFLEAFTRETLWTVLKDAKSYEEIHHEGFQLVEANGEHFAIVAFPLDDFLSSIGEREKSVGYVFFWRSVDDQITALHASNTFNIIFAILAFLLIELIIFIAFGIASRGLQRLIDKRTSEYKQAMELAQAAGKAKTEFLSGMSHELRTPLNGVIGLSSLLMMEGAVQSEDEVRDYARQINTSGSHLLELINSLLEFSAMESGKVEVELSQIKLDEVIQVSTDLVRPLAKQKDIEMRWDEPAADGISVRGDSMRIKQVLVNLLSNAVKYNNRSGKVFVTVAPNGENVAVSVRDTGIGIPDAMKDRVFAAFDRLGRERSEIEGTGVGMSIAKRLAEMMEGSLNFESTEGEGSTFTLMLKKWKD